MVRKILLFLLPILLISNIAFSQNISFRVTGISGLAFIEKTDINKSLRAFRGSEIHKDYRLRTSSNTQVELTILKNGNKVGEIVLPQNTILLVNDSLRKEDNNKVALSLLSGYIKVNINKDIGSLVEIHTATTSTIVTGTLFEVGFAENGATIVSLTEGSVDVVTDKEETTLNSREAYINTMYDDSKIIKQSSYSDPIVFLNKGEEESREDYVASIENLMEAMENIPKDDVSVLAVTGEENEDYIENLERKQYRMRAANEGYYNTIVRLINLEPSKKNEMIAYARKSLTLYTANQRAISKMNNAVMKNREKFDRIKKDFDRRMMSKVSN